MKPAEYEAKSEALRAERQRTDFPAPLAGFSPDMFDPLYWDQAAEALASRNVARLLLSVRGGNVCWLDFVASHAHPLRHVGLFESALLFAIVGASLNHAREYDTLRWLLSLADRDRLRAAGKPLPGSGPFTLYRGVSGHPPRRQVRGVCWTASLEKARWFAHRLFREAPAVYRILVPADAILAYTNARQEQEFLLAPDAVPRRPRRIE